MNEPRRLGFGRGVRVSGESNIGQEDSMKYVGYAALALAIFETSVRPPHADQVSATLPVPACGPHVPCPPPCGCGWEMLSVK
jgi:hypothetical protein